ncbi:MAG: efflux RND transporter periplasmic adaptor subunit [Limisphaerales bacterium]
MKTVLKIALPLVILGLTGLAVHLLIKHKREIKPEPVTEVVPLVEVVSVKPGPHQFVVRSQGEVAARTEIDLVGEVSGRIEWAAEGFADGGFFREGEALLRIDRRDYDVAVTQADAAVAQARVLLERELAEAKVAKKEWEALGKGRASALLLREPQLAQAQSGIRSAEAALDKAKLDLTRCEIKAPFNGRVRMKNAGVGQVINRGVPVARIYAVDYVEIRLPLPLDELGFLDFAIGANEPDHQPAVQISAELGGNQCVWQGRLVRTAGSIDGQTRMLMGVVRVDDPYGLNRKKTRTPLALGLFVDAEIEGKEVAGVYRVPRAAMRGEDQTIVVDTEGQLRFRTVEVLRLTAKEALLTSGIEEGDRICVSLLDAPVDGMNVNPRELEP